MNPFYSIAKNSGISKTEKYFFRITKKKEIEKKFNILLIA